MENNDKLIVSITSWQKRIHHVIDTLKMMNDQILRPEKVYLVLSEEEFKNKENDLPKNLLDYINNNNIFEIYWTYEDTKSFKKLLPILKKYINENIWIATIDDDVKYDKNYLKKIIILCKLTF